MKFWKRNFLKTWQVLCQLTNKGDSTGQPGLVAYQPSWCICSRCASEELMSCLALEGYNKPESSHWLWSAWNHFKSFCMYRHVEAMWLFRLHTLLDANLVTHVLPKEVLDTGGCHLPRYVQLFPFLQPCGKKWGKINGYTVLLCNPTWQQKIEPSQLMEMAILFGYPAYVYECVQVRSGPIVHAL